MIKFTKLTMVTFLIFFATQNIFADTHYVSKTGGHVSPFDSWANAATNIQAAVDTATDGDTVLVNDGTYYPGSQISVAKDLTVKSVNGAEKTIVDGNKTNRCFNLSSSHPWLQYKTTIDGFTITNGYTSGDGGGIYCDEGGLVQNCKIGGNSASSGGGVCCDEGGLVQNCKIVGNQANGYVGGGIYCYKGGTIQNCTINKNTANEKGGGINCGEGGIVKNCKIIGNSTTHRGGGVYCYKGLIQNCIISKNTASYSFGSIITGEGGGIFCDYITTIQNCTISGNSGVYSGGVSCYGDSVTIENSIIWNNNGGNYFSDCTMIYNYFADPQFISANDYRLQSASPCRNSGTNDQYVFETFDLDGNSRIMGATVDMGAYEYVEAFQYLPYQAPIIDISEINIRKISWTPLNEILRAEDFVVQEQFGGTQGIWSTIYTGTNSSLFIQKISNGYYRVAAHNSIGYKWSDAVLYSNHPINITILNSEQITDGSGYVSIQPQIKDPNLDLSELKIEYSLNNGASWTDGDPYLISVTQNEQAPAIDNSLEYQVTNILPDESVATILWDTKSAQNGGGSLANQKIDQAKIRITPKNAYSQGYSMFSSPFEIDNSLVNNATITINNDEITTISPYVKLQLSAEGSTPLKMRISRASDFRDTDWESYKTTKDWELSPGDGIKTVYAEFKNPKGYVMAATDTIKLKNQDYSNFSVTNSVTFSMGRSGSEANEAPVHSVTLTTAAVYKTEVSNFEFAQFVTEYGYSESTYWSSEGWDWRVANNIICPMNWNTNDSPDYANDLYSNSDNKPVVGISYYEAEAYCNWAGCELPTEAQWEYFAKGSEDNRQYPWAEDFWYTSTQPTFELCNWKIGYESYSENGFTDDAAEYANTIKSYPLGISHIGNYNMSGNVAEWVKDWYGDYSASSATNPEGAESGTERVVRGGSFIDLRGDLTTTRRQSFSPEFRTNWLGMRIAHQKVYNTFPGDTFTNSAALPDDKDIATGSNTNAPIELGEQEHAGNGGPYHSVWWDWSAESVGKMKSKGGDVLLVDTHGSDFDTVLAIYTGNEVDNLTTIAANDDYTVGIKTSELYFDFVEGEVYSIVVDGKTIGDIGEVVLNYEVVPEPVLLINFYLLFIIYYLKRK